MPTGFPSKYSHCRQREIKKVFLSFLLFDLFIYFLYISLLLFWRFGKKSPHDPSRPCKVIVLLAKYSGGKFDKKSNQINKFVFYLLFFFSSPESILFGRVYSLTFILLTAATPPTHLSIVPLTVTNRRNFSSVPDSRTFVRSSRTHISKTQ